ncbi:hypothetical protein PC116_g23600 [Phytophthora cactorum]|uniref:Uncharacterized protein n=1 Tax=Phytophthora cactorum TaxID=29920 RepID=A0A8T1JVJ2_9STRA|nr:hypothetical protein PC112_g19509 [Phytophthora cactorum]KAG2803525.1 hypothetical protein PC111_g18641 [Phytophthora cactorum]KAG2843629.1 hypothetical protein PC113_g18567 [Phytophthora cactorum]KAG2899195.1 hypothetical protein PC115_g16617 [Phytophthora cactorum]KAG2903679.1 hypothetical protein PC117_g21223 [Phytophthora cactorum]
MEACFKQANDDMRIKMRENQSLCLKDIVVLNELKRAISAIQGLAKFRGRSEKRRTTLLSRRRVQDQTSSDEATARCSFVKKQFILISV